MADRKPLAGSAEQPRRTHDTGNDPSTYVLVPIIMCNGLQRDQEQVVVLGDTVTGKGTPIAPSNRDRATLESWMRSGTTQQRLVVRAKLVLAAAEGKQTKQIAAELHI